MAVSKAPGDRLHPGREIKDLRQHGPVELLCLNDVMECHTRLPARGRRATGLENDFKRLNGTHLSQLPGWLAALGFTLITELLRFAAPSPAPYFWSVINFRLRQ